MYHVIARKAAAVASDGAGRFRGIQDGRAHSAGDVCRSRGRAREDGASAGRRLSGSGTHDPRLGVSDPVERLRRTVRVYALRHATHRREALVANRDTASLPEPARTRVRQKERDHERAVPAIICDGVGTDDFHVDSPALASFAILEMCLSIARWFRDDGARTAEQVADEYADFALRIAGFVPDRPSPAGRAQQGPDDPDQ
jgi:Tetracyclin repressor-like, C-terminal domain